MLRRHTLGHIFRPGPVWGCDTRASYLKYALDDSQAACDEARNLISSLSSERDGLASEVSTLHSTFSDFKEKMEAQQEAQAQELYNRVAEL
ncbi:hypothetical protein Tco_0463489, partial [Tanacetum coccineum]